MARPRYVQAQKFKLSGSGITASDTTIILTSMKLPDGVTNITTADLGDTGTYPAYMTIEPGTSKEELISFTTITQNVGGTATLTGVTRGLAFTNPHAETSANKFSHAGGAIIILTNASVLYQKIIDYIDGIAVAGTTDASTTVKGIVEEATSAEMIAGTGAGGTGARLFINPTLVAETGSDKIIKTKSTGILDQSIIPVLSGHIKSGAVTKDISSTASTTIAHGLGATPTLVKVTGTFTSDSDDTISYASTVYSASTQSSVSFVKNGTIESSGASFIFYKTTGAFSVGTITVDSTNITIAWAKTSTPTGDINLIWEAYK